MGFIITKSPSKQEQTSLDIAHRPTLCYFYGGSVSLLKDCGNWSIYSYVELQLQSWHQLFPNTMKAVGKPECYTDNRRPEPGVVRLANYWHSFSVQLFVDCPGACENTSECKSSTHYSRWLARAYQKQAPRLLEFHRYRSRRLNGRWEIVRMVSRL